MHLSSTRDYNESHVTSSVRMGKQEVNSWSRLMDTRSKNWCKAAEVVEPGLKKISSANCVSQYILLYYTEHLEWANNLLFSFIVHCYWEIWMQCWYIKHMEKLQEMWYVSFTSYNVVWLCVSSDIPTFTFNFQALFCTSLKALSMQACLKNKTLEKDMLLIDFMNVRNQLNVCYVQRTQGAYSMYLNNMLKHCVTVMVALFCVMRCTFLKVV